MAVGSVCALPGAGRDIETAGERSEDTSAARGVLLGTILGGLLWTGLLVGAFLLQSTWFN